MKKEIKDEFVLQWQPIDITPRLQQMCIIFDKVRYKTPPSPQVTIGENFLEVVINNRSDLDRFGVTEYGTYRFWYLKNEVERKI